MKPRRSIALTAVVVSCTSLLIGPPKDARAFPQSPVASTSSRAAEADRPPLIVHEWGTFTSFSGSDGISLEFRPLTENDLPPFVFNRTRQSTWLLGKPQLSALQRMETPVTYFYTPVEREVRVRVEFPSGLLTEYFPPVRSYSPVNPPVSSGTSLHSNAALRGSALDWGTVHLIPRSALRPHVGDAELADRIAEHVEATMIPAAPQHPHYSSARATDSAIIHVRFDGETNGSQPRISFPGLGGTGMPYMPRSEFFEKFLFYRGLGDFRLPLKLQAISDSTFKLNNDGPEPISSLFLVTVRGKSIWFSHADRIAGNSRLTLKQSLAPAPLSDLEQAVTAALVQTGLYEKEARAMVKTWSGSWFGEEGTRLFYVLPSSVTEALLPLSIEPKPDELIRVLVGRLEIMSPGEEQRILRLLASSADARSSRKPGEKETFESPALARLKAMGRLAEPALVRASQIAPSDELRQEAKRLIDALGDQDH